MYQHLRVLWKITHTKFYNHKFPLILAIDFIEHTPNPTKIITAVEKIIEKNGIFIIDTPNSKSTNLKRLGSKWRGFNPFHIYLFSIENLSMLLKEHGFIIEKSFSYNNSIYSHNPRYLLHHLLHIIKPALSKLHLLHYLLQTYLLLQKINILSKHPTTYLSTTCIR